MIPSFIAKNLIPHKPGVYIFKDGEGKVIYVGKAIDLYHRVSSYFSGRFDSVKTSVLVEKIRDCETILVESELEALILEANLIKTYKPLFNIRLTDDKDYLYIVITTDPFAKVLTTRKQDLSKIKRYYGPFPSSRVVKDTLKKLRRVFPWCSNPPGKMNNMSRPCFYYHLNLCPGACVGKISQKEYQKIINNFSRFLEGKKDELIVDLKKEMEFYSQHMEFEQAQRIKKMLDGILYITSPNRISMYLENPNYLESENRLAITELQQDLNLKNLPERIETYDISNISGTNATGSMVVLTMGEVDKSQYRRFKILISGKPNDVGMHKEMIARRLKHEEWRRPDLILVDGGRGQVRGYKELLDKKGWDVPVFGIAKRLELLYPPEGEIIKIPKKKLSLRLIQKIRDEAHRFAITYHRKLRGKAFIPKSGK